MIAVLDTNAVIGLAKGECLEQLRSLFWEVVVPPAVRREVVEEGAGRAGARELQAGLGDWIREQALVGPAAAQGTPGLSVADQEILGLALQQPAVLVTDDVALLREARRLGVATLGAVETVLLMKRHGLLTAIKPVLDRMQARAYHIAPPLLQEALRLSGEEPPTPA